MYKRQALERGESASKTGRKHIPTRLFKQAVNLSKQARAIEATLDGITPVSYTHLDVYKRQAWRGTASAGLVSSADRAYMKAPVPRSTLDFVTKCPELVDLLP